MAPNGNGSASGEVRGCNYMLHQVTKMDTLAGIAIKYGVEVADIKRMNGLATDLQMFALKTLQIPLPGRHPPSSNPTGDCDFSGENSPEQTPPRKSSLNMLESLESLRLTPQPKVSPAMSTLQKFYGLKSTNSKNVSEGTEMTIYRTGTSHVSGNTLLPKSSPIRDSTARYEKLVNGFATVDNGLVGERMPLAEVDGDSEGSSVRRRQKVESGFGAGTLLKEENSGGSSDFSKITGKNLALRPKSASRTSLVADAESSWLNFNPFGNGDSVRADELSGVRKSSSLSSLQDQEGGGVSSILPIMWNLKPELSISKPIFDGLPIPISGRKSKAALD